MQTKIKQLVIIILCIFCFATVSFAQKKAGFQLPKYEKFSLPNGLTLYLMEQHEVPVINVSAIMPAGAIYDGEKNGLASLAASCLPYGTKSFTKNEIEQQLDFVGATLNTYASKESAGLSAKFAKKDADKIFPIIKEVLLDPVFNEAEFEKEKKRTLVNLEQAKESPRTVISSYWDAFYYGDQAYGNPVSGKISSVSKITDTDLKNFYQSNYIPNQSALAVAGDFDTKEMKSRLTTLFSGWKKSNRLPDVVATTIKTPSEKRVLLVNKDDATETTLYIGGKGVKRNNPDYVAMEVVNTVLGGRFTSWLNDELRVNSGLTYGARSSFSSLKNAGTFAISTFTANKTTEPTIDKSLEVLNRLHTQGIDEETLTSAKNYVKGLFPPRYETSGQLANLLTQMFWYGFDDAYINKFQTNVDAIDVAKAKQIIQTYFPKDNLQFVLIGKASEIKPIAEKLGPVTELQIKEDGFK